MRIPSIVALVAVSAFSYADPIQTEIKDVLFDDVYAALSKAYAVEANTYAPRTFLRGSKHFFSAKEEFERGGNLEGIRRDLQESTTYYRTAAELAQVARAALPFIVAARTDALTAEAPKSHEDNWKALDSDLKSAMAKFQKGRTKRATRLAKRAEPRYRAIELEAIKAKNLGVARTLIGQARAVDAPRIAPVSFRKAISLIEQAESRLERDRYDTEAPAAIIAQAEYEARHSLYVAQLEQKVARGEENLESVLLQWQASLRRIGDRLEVPLEFDNGEVHAVDAILRRLTDLERATAQRAKDTDETEDGSRTMRVASGR